MRLYFLILLLIVVSCSSKTIEIKSINSYVDKPSIRTTDVLIHEEIQQIQKEPKIDIILPKDGEVIRNNKIFVVLNISNFKLVTPEKYPKQGQGHSQVWIDGMEFRSSKTQFVFENEINGTHVIKAELMLSNNTVLPYSKTIKVIVNRTS